MQDLLLDLWSAHTPTVVYITHDIDEALRLADRVVVMSHRPGRVLEEFVVSAARPRDIRHDRGMIDRYEAIWKILQAEISAQDGTER
jgi:ABC-type nitrate/sulfonate/bicarbonate transport system ATPase subunit